MLLLLPAFATQPGNWICDGKYELCRYVERQTKQEIIPARFERGMAFSEGLAAVSLGGQFGYIDERGEMAIEPRFDRAGPFRQGLAEVIRRGQGRGHQPERRDRRCGDVSTRRPVDQ
jgi:hypothetical protein